MGWAEIMGGIVDTAAQTIKANEGDYYVNGLLYCHKCHTPKQCKVEFLGMVVTPMCLCKCEAEKVEQAEKESKRLAYAKHIDGLRNSGFPDAEMKEYTFAADDSENEKVSMIARRYVDNFQTMREKGKGLLFYGTVGTGKTFLAACIANALIDKGYPCLVTNFARLINTLQGMYEGKQEYIDGLDRYELLVIDDLAAERDTEYMQEMVTNIIDARYRSGKPLIVTTNLTANDLKNPADMKKQRVYSRLLEMCIPVEVAGRDRRKVKMKNDYQEIGKILGV